MSLLEQALDVAYKAHKGLYRKNKKIKLSYIIHPCEVMKKTFDWGVHDEEALAAALLHDVVEDTPVTLDELKQQFNERVCMYVAELTQDENISKEEYLEKFTNCSIQAFVVKVSDRLCNIVDFANEHKYPKYFKSLERFFELVKLREAEIIEKFGMKVLKRIYEDFISVRDLLENEYNFSVNVNL